MKFEIKEIEDYLGGKEKNGRLICFLRNSDLKGNKEFQQIYYSEIPPGVTRGNHFHKMKEEYFMVLTGKIRLKLEDVKTHEKREIIIDSDEIPPKRIWIGIFVAHNLTNISKKTVRIVEYVTKSFDPENPDRHEYKLN